MNGPVFAELFGRTRVWFERAAAEGWIAPADLQRFRAIEQATPADLFVAGSPRPLVVAFFGGTGVGKSSLLNRLAAERIARTGVERPTSFEVTLYAHERVELADLPPEMPVNQVKVVRHGAKQWRDVLWMDMPDIDSTHADNRQCAFAWLPYVDLVVYVVSPERYRDDVGWRVLLERGGRHGWMFVINRWDEGDPAQPDDFTGILRRAGFADPLLLTTTCRENAAANTTSETNGPTDQFEQLETALAAVLNEHGVRELERLGYRARALELERILREARGKFGDDARWCAVESTFATCWETAASSIRESVELSLRSVASRLAAREQSMFEGLRRRATSAVSRPGAALLTAATGLKLPKALPGTEPSHDASGAVTGGASTPDHATHAANPLQPGEVAHLLRSFWDDWTEGRLKTCLDAVELELQRAGIPVAPARSALADATRQMRSTVLDAVHRRVREALSNPAPPWRVSLRRGAHWLSYTLPGAALVLVAIVVIYRFANAAIATGGEFLSFDFAIHAALLVLVAWALPFAAEQALRPRLDRIVLDGLRGGVEDGLAAAREHAASTIDKTVAAAAGHRREAEALLEQIKPFAPMSPSGAAGTLRRLLAGGRGGAIG